jgi:hypothetical protein
MSFNVTREDHDTTVSGDFGQPPLNNDKFNKKKPASRPTGIGSYLESLNSRSFTENHEPFPEHTSLTEDHVTSLSKHENYEDFMDDNLETLSTDEFMESFDDAYPQEDFVSTEVYPSIPSEKPKKKKAFSYPAGLGPKLENYLRSLPKVIQLRRSPPKKKPKKITVVASPTGTESYLESLNRPSLPARIRNLFRGRKGKKLDRATLAKMGTNFVLAYGFVSNVSGCIAVSCAWFVASKRSGLSPLAPGQWKTFTAAYAGFFVLLNVIRPARFALSIAISKYWENVIRVIQDRFKVNKATAVGLVVFLVNICGSIALMALGIFTASLLSGVPVWSR